MTKQQLNKYCSAEFENIDSVLFELDLVIKPKKTSLDKKIISDKLYDALLNYLSFRHFFVHAYSFTLRWEELKPLVNLLESTPREFKTAIHDYINNLD